MWLSERADYESWPLSSVLLTLSIWITVGLGLLSSQYDHPCWRAKGSQRPHKAVQAVERNTKPPIHITKEMKNESQELHKRRGIFYLHGMKHGCLEPWNKFRGRNQLQLGAGPCFNVYFTGLNGFVMLHGTPKKQPAQQLACLRRIASHTKLLADGSNNLGHLAAFSQWFLLVWDWEISLKALSWSLEHP